MTQYVSHYNILLNLFIYNLLYFFRSLNYIQYGKKSSHSLKFHFLLAKLRTSVYK